MTPTLPCLYAVKTGRTPEERFENHKDGLLIGQVHLETALTYRTNPLGD